MSLNEGRRISICKWLLSCDSAFTALFRSSAFFGLSEVELRPLRQIRRIPIKITKTTEAIIAMKTGRLISIELEFTDS